MVTKKYKIGNFIYQVISPVEYEEESYIKPFCIDEGEADYTVNIELVDSLPQTIENPIWNTTSKICTQTENGVTCYFRNMDSDGELNLIYARKTMEYNSKECTISILESMKFKISSRVLIIFMCMEEMTAENNCVIFHSSYINYKGKAVIFTGPCGIGKSTQADLWKKYRGTPIINGDKTLFYEDNGIYMAGGLPFSGSSEYCENVNLPIGAIVKLSQAKENSAHVENGIEAFMSIIRSCYPVSYSEYLINKQIDFAKKMSEFVPVISYSCLADESAVIYLEDMLCQIL